MAGSSSAVAKPSNASGAQKRGGGGDSSTTASELAEAQGEVKQLKAFIEDVGHFSLVRNFRLADCVTIMNGVCGSLSVFNCGKYLITQERSYLWIALWAPLAGMFFDLFDGKIARWRKESSMLGQELDSLADSISFGVAPAFLAFTIGCRSTLDIFALTTFICCGIARLARFNATVALLPKDTTGKSKFFEGLPIPTSLVLVTCMATCVHFNRIEGPNGIGKGLPGGFIDILEKTPLEMHWFSIIFVVWAALMISKTLHIPKP